MTATTVAPSRRLPDVDASNAKGLTRSDQRALADRLQLATTAILGLAVAPAWRPEAWGPILKEAQ